VTFEVGATPEIAGGYCHGLRALKGEHRSAMRPKTSQCRWRGSVDLEERLAPRYPGSPQWDYAVGFGYANRPDGVAYVEVHPASSSHVQDVIRKKDWLTSWIRRCAPSLGGLAVGGFFWVATGSVHIHPGTPQHIRLAQCGITVNKVACIG
jgi:hypothetical protein